MDEHRVDYKKKEQLTKVEPAPAEKAPEPIEKAPAPKPSKTEATKSMPEGNQQGGFIDFIKGKKRILGTRLEQANEIVIEDSRIRIICEKGSPVSHYLKRQESKDTLKNYSGEFFSREMRIDIEETDTPAKKSQEDKLQSSNTKERKALNRKKIHDDPIVKEAEEIFGGRVIDTKPN